MISKYEVRVMVEGVAGDRNRRYGVPANGEHGKSVVRRDKPLTSASLIFKGEAWCQRKP